MTIRFALALHIQPSLRNSTYVLHCPHQKTNFLTFITGSHIKTIKNIQEEF